jgi:hypothetical protein
MAARNGGSCLSRKSPFLDQDRGSVFPKHGSIDFCSIDKGDSIGCNACWERVVILCVIQVTFSDPSRQIAQTRILSLRWIDALWGMVLRAASCGFCRADLCCLWEMGIFDAQNSRPVWPPRLNSLPTGLNRISWKPRLPFFQQCRCTPDPTDWVKSD